MTILLNEDLSKEIHGAEATRRQPAYATTDRNGAPRILYRNACEERLAQFRQVTDLEEAPRPELGEGVVELQRGAARNPAVEGDRVQTARIPQTEQATQAAPGAGIGNERCPGPRMDGAPDPGMNEARAGLAASLNRKLSEARRKLEADRERTVSEIEAARQQMVTSLREIAVIDAQLEAMSSALDSRALRESLDRLVREGRIQAWQMFNETSPMDTDIRIVTPPLEMGRAMTGSEEAPAPGRAIVTISTGAAGIRVALPDLPDGVRHTALDETGRLTAVLENDAASQAMAEMIAGSDVAGALDLVIDCLTDASNISTAASSENAESSEIPGDTPSGPYMTLRNE